MSTTCVCGNRTRGGVEVGGISDHATGNTSWDEADFKGASHHPAGEPDEFVALGAAICGVFATPIAGAGTLTVDGDVQSSGLAGAVSVADDCPGEAAGPDGITGSGSPE